MKASEKMEIAEQRFLEIESAYNVEKSGAENKSDLFIKKIYESYYKLAEGVKSNFSSSDFKKRIFKIRRKREREKELEIKKNLPSFTDTLLKQQIYELNLNPDSYY